ncbi:MAG: hypothetical protein L7V86_15350 [Verrucomicrobiales bacterium]|nr:hypothetical protein [Verrucomicrobiales bacterium]
MSFQEATRISNAYQPDADALNGLSQDYGRLIESAEERRRWRAEAAATPGLDRLAGVWAFRNGEDIDTGRPVLEKAVVVPGVLWSSASFKALEDGSAWGYSADYARVRKEGKDSYLVAYFRR